jgi:hypothetical protein
MAGFADTFLERLKHFQAEGGVIFAVSGADLKQLISSKTRLSRWLRGPGVIRSLGNEFLEFIPGHSKKNTARIRTI